MLDKADSLAQWLQDELNQHGWTQSELGRRVGLSSSTVSDILSSKAKPGSEFCKGVARAFGISAVEVFQRAGILPPVPPQTANWQRLNEMWPRLAPQDQEHVLEIVEMWVQKRGTTAD